MLATAVSKAAGRVRRPVWLFSLDSSRYPDAVPVTTGGLKAYFQKYARTADATDVKLVHFHSHLDVGAWFSTHWMESEKQLAEAGCSRRIRPVAGISCYTWNTTIFLNLARRLKRAVPELLVVAGGPQVQEASNY